MGNGLHGASTPAVVAQLQYKLNQLACPRLTAHKGIPEDVLRIIGITGAEVVSQQHHVHGQDVW
jgi:hypothetical protein